MAANDEPSSSYTSRRSDDEMSHRRIPRDYNESTKHRDTRRHRSTSPSNSTAPHAVLERFGIPPLTADDYFIRSAEFKAWLSTKSKYLDEIPSKDARRYFDRFVRRWNEGRLGDEYYRGTVRTGSGSQTRHRWNITKDTNDEQKMALIRDTVDTLTNGDSKGAAEARDAERRLKHGRSSNKDDDDILAPKRDSGWTSRAATTSSSKGYAETQFEREHDQQLDRIAASEHRRRARQDLADQEEALHGRATGRERVFEKKRQLNAANRDFADRRHADDGIEMDDGELYDQDNISRGDTEKTRSKRERARQDKMEERKAEMQDKVRTMKDRDAKTMDMFRALAQQRFGGGGGIGE